MFTFYDIATNPLKEGCMLTFYSPRCRLDCEQCFLPFKTQDVGAKLDVVAIIRRYRPSLSAVNFYLGDMSMDSRVGQRYFFLVKNRWPGLDLYLSFSFPDLLGLGRFIRARLLDGIIYYLHFSPERPHQFKDVFDEWGLTPRQVVSAIVTFFALHDDSVAPPVAFVKI